MANINHESTCYPVKLQFQCRLLQVCGRLETAGNNIGLRYTIEILKNYIVDPYVEIPCNLNDLYKYG